MEPTATAHLGDNRDVLKTIPSNSIDSVVTDPPYELGFMGKAWDSSGIAYQVDLWAEVLRVLKPGGHLLAFGGTRTYHRMAVAIEDAGFEIRDSIYWVYGSGFPKSLDVSKAIDKAAGAQRAVVGTSKGVKVSPDDNQHGGINRGAVGIKQVAADIPITAPATDAAKQWEGWGTALKPAHEPIVVARKPLIGTVAANVLEYNTGAMNIDGCRVAATDKANFPKAGYTRHDTDASYEFAGDPNFTTTGIDANPSGRWPANVIHDSSDEVTAMFPDDTARFFYAAKASRAERNAGLDKLPQRDVHRYGAGIGEGKDPNAPARDTNFHPTVKPLALMRYLLKLVTPPAGTTLDPFAGSGTTLIAAIHEGFNSIGIELTPEYHPIIQARIKHAQTTRKTIT